MKHRQYGTQSVPRDVSDNAWAFVAPSLTLMTEDAPQRNYPLRDIVNGLHRIARGGRTMAHDAARPAAVGSRLSTDAGWMRASVCEAMVHA
jgi:transposase